MNEWMNDGCMNDKRMHECMNAWMHECINEWIMNALMIVWWMH